MLNITVVNGQRRQRRHMRVGAHVPRRRADHVEHEPRARSGQGEPRVVPVGPDGKIRLYNDYGNAHLIVDVLGYL